MKMLMPIALCLAALGAHAQSVYRCNNAYSQEPCPQARLVDVADVRSEAQRSEARRVAADEQRRGTQMERERLALLTAQRPAGAANIGPAALGVQPRSAERTPPRKLKWTKVKPANVKPEKAARARV